MKARVKYRIGPTEWIAEENHPYAKSRAHMENWIANNFKAIAAGRTFMCSYEILEITE